MINHSKLIWKSSGVKEGSQIKSYVCGVRAEGIRNNTCIACESLTIIVWTV